MTTAHGAETGIVDSWDEALSRMRADGFSIVDSIKVTKSVLGVSLADAKRIVHDSSAWRDQRDSADRFHDSIEAVAASEFD